MFSKIKSLLAEYGWSDTYRLSLDEKFTSVIPDEHPALYVLTRLGGLHIGETGAGTEVAKDDLLIQYVEPDDDVIPQWEKQLNTKLIGIGLAHHAHGELYIASDGRCFGNSTIHDDFYFEGATFEDAVLNMTSGVKSKPMLLPDQESVTLYGAEYKSDSFFSLNRLNSLK